MQYQVSFRVVKGCLNVRPPFVEGERDSFWVRAKNEADAKIEAVIKAQKCYGIEIADLKIANSF